MLNMAKYREKYLALDTLVLKMKLYIYLFTFRISDFVKSSFYDADIHSSKLGKHFISTMLIELFKK